MVSGDKDRVIQERDREILKRCYEQQFLLREHVEHSFFKGAEARNARQRILEMERVGWVKKERIAGLTQRQIIRLTRTGATLAKEI